MKVRRLSILILNIFLLATLTGLTYSSTYNIYYSQAAPISAETPKVILQEGTAGTSTIYTNNTSAKVIAVAPAPTPTYYPDTYNVVNGTYLSGSVPDSVQIVDADYFVVESPSSSIGYNPSGYNLLGSTTYVSGSLTDLQSDNGVYMAFRSYVSASSTTAKTNAFVAYRDSTNSLNTPKERTWTGDTASWGSQSEMPTAESPVRWVRVAYCPIEARCFEKMVVTLSDDGYLDAYVWNGTAWLVTNNIGFVGTTANAYRCFDVAYEKTSGRALLVYSTGGGAVDMQYKIWNGTAWSTAYNLDLTATASGTNVYWVTLAQKPTSGANEIALLCIEGTNCYPYAKIWNGTAWGNEKTLTTRSLALNPPKEEATIVYEQVSGYAVVLVARSNQDEFSVRWNGSAWESNVDTDFAGSAVVHWLTAKADPVSNKIFVVAIDSSVRLYTQYWDGSAWLANAIQQDNYIDTNAARCADFAWEPTGSKGLLVWGTSPGQITYRTFTAPDTWGTTTSVAMGANIHPWVQLRTNPRNINGDVGILGAALEDTANCIGAISWNGTTFTIIGTNTISSNTTVATYECFELEFCYYGDPEFTAEVEFTGTSNTEDWTQLEWTIDSCFTTDGVTATFQLYDYNAGQYPTSGDGYITDTIGTTDTTKNQIITTNPARFRDSSGNWKIKAKGVKAATLFDFKVDWIEIKQYYSQYITSTEFIFSNMTTHTPTQLNFTVVSEYTVSSVNVTIQVWNYSSSAYVTNGEGYLTYTSEGANETKLLSINTNPEFYTSNGYAKIKVTGSTTTEFQQKINQIKLTYRYSASSTYDYVLKIVNQAAENWTINIQIYNSSNIERISSLNISLHDGASSNQIAISEGTIVKSEGEPYNLTENTTIYISINNLQATTTSTSYLYVYLKIKVPNTTTYTLFIITFEIT